MLLLQLEQQLLQPAKSCLQRHLCLLCSDWLSKGVLEVPEHLAETKNPETTGVS